MSPSQWFALDPGTLASWTRPPSWRILLGGLVLAAGLFGGAETPATAQSAWGQSSWDVPVQERNRRPWEHSLSPQDVPQDRGVEPGTLDRIPGWAAPQRDPRHGTAPNYGDLQWGNTERKGNAERQGNGVQMNGGPTLPGNPNRVPLGGLEWLLAAGAGYGAHRLRNCSQDSDDTASV